MQSRSGIYSESRQIRHAWRISTGKPDASRQRGNWFAPVLEVIAAKEATNTAFNFLKANAKRISSSISMATKDYNINYQDLQGIGITEKLALPTVIALSSIALNKPLVKFNGGAW